VDETVILELKAARAVIPVHAARMKSYLQATGYPTGLILNFGMPELQWEVHQRDISVLSEPSPNNG